MGNGSRRLLLVDWCARGLGPGELTQLSQPVGGQMSVLYRYTSEGADAAIKVRAESAERVNACLSLQKILAREGFVCARPLLDAEEIHSGYVVSAEEWRPGGEVLRGDNTDTARRSAVLLAELMAILHDQPVRGFGPPPPWLHWNSPGAGPWPPNDAVDRMDQSLVPASIQGWAVRVSARMRNAELPPVLGHGDWEAQNIRWKDDGAWAVHDWDSLVSLPEAAIVGAASGAFASVETPTLASIDSSAAFVSAYESTRGRTFTQEELEIAWAASLWPALHNARGEHLFRSPLVASIALTDQAQQRMRLAKA